MSCSQDYIQRPATCDNNKVYNYCATYSDFECKHWTSMNYSQPEKQEEYANVINDMTSPFRDKCGSNPDWNSVRSASATCNND